MKKRHAEKRVLPGWVFDGLALSAEAFGGIGAAHWHFFRQGVDAEEPNCAAGMCGEMSRHPQTADEVEARARLRDVGIGEQQNDGAVIDVNSRNRKPRYSRITFDEWCAELDVVPDYAVAGSLSTEATK